MLIKTLLFFLSLTMSQYVLAAPVVYKFTGLLSGEGEPRIFQPLDQIVSIVDAPFEISIFADTDNAVRLGSVAGAGSLYANESFSATWTIEGIGTLSTDRAQIYTLPGIFRIGYGWGGQVYPFTTTEPYEPNKSLYFRGFTGDATLTSTADSVSVWLDKPLVTEADIQTLFNIGLFFDDIGPFNVKDINSVTYSVQPVPLPAAFWLLLSGLFGVFSFSRIGKNESDC